MNKRTSTSPSKTARWVPAPLPADPELARSSVYQGVYLEEGEEVRWFFDSAGRVMGYEIIEPKEESRQSS